MSRIFEGWRAPGSNVGALIIRIGFWGFLIVIMV